MKSIDHIFTYHAPLPGQPEKYEKLRNAAKLYAEALTSERVLNEDGELVLEMAYEDYIRAINELTPTESLEVQQAMKLIDQAYDIAIDPNRAIVLLVQAASYFVNASIALHS